MRRAFIGDVHGCIAELEELLRKLEHESVDEIWHLGDLVDRGPDSGAVVRKRLKGILGNHDSTIVNRYDSVKKGANVRYNEDKDRTISQLVDDDIEYMRNLPLLHVFDDIKVAIVHAGVEPGKPLWKQNEIVKHLQMLHPDFPGATRWWGYDPRNECTEEENRANGWQRWYEVADEPYLVVYGHSVYPEPFKYNQTLGIDTGCVFGGALTAVILPDMRFVSVPAKQVYVRGKNPKNPYMTDP